MKLFKSKAEKEQEKKMLIKKSIKELDKRIELLDRQLVEYKKAVRVAQSEGLPEQVKLATDAIRMTIAERRRTVQMKLNTQIISQMKDMSAMTGEFLNTVKVISKSIAGNTNTDVNKISSELQMAMDQVADQTERLGDMLEDAQTSVGDFSADTNLVSDEEINRLIYGAGEEDVVLDDELQKLKSHLK